MRRHRLLPVTIAALILGCTDSQGPVAPDHHRVSAVLLQAPADIGGSWSETRENFIHLTELAAGLFGFIPEGARTTIRCAAQGTLTIDQDGESFTGSLTEGFVCASKGGQVVDFGEETLEITDGRIRGRSIHFTLLGIPGPVECPARGTLTIDGGVVVAMHGTWQCVEPGHPQSVWEGVPPPRLGPNLSRWTAIRTQ